MSIFTKVRDILDGLEGAGSGLLAPPDAKVQDTARGALIGVKTAIAMYRLTGDPILTGIAAAFGALNAIEGAKMDNLRQQQMQGQVQGGMQHDHQRNHNQYPNGGQAHGI